MNGHLTGTLAVGSAFYPRPQPPSSVAGDGLTSSGGRGRPRPVRPASARPVAPKPRRGDEQVAAQRDVVVVGDLGITGHAAIHDGPGGADRLRERLADVVSPAGLGQGEDRTVDTATILAAVDVLAGDLVGEGDSTGITLVRALSAAPSGLRVGAAGTVSRSATPGDPDLGLRLLEKTGADTRLVETTDQLGAYALLVPDAFGATVVRHAADGHPLGDFVRVRGGEVVDYLARSRVVVLDLPPSEGAADQCAGLVALLRHANPAVRVIIHSFRYPGRAADLVSLAEHADLLVVHEPKTPDLRDNDPTGRDPDVAGIVAGEPGPVIVQFGSRTVKVIRPTGPPAPIARRRAATVGETAATRIPGTAATSYAWTETADPIDGGPGRQRLAILATLAGHAARDAFDLDQAIRDGIACVNPRRPRPAPTPAIVEPTPAQLALVAATPITRGSNDRDGLTGFVDALTAAGQLPDEAWRTAFAGVPRHLFLPTFFVRRPGQRWRAIDRHHHDYWRLVYSDQGLATQLDGSILPHPTQPSVVGEPTSAGDRPGLIADLLHALTDTIGEPIGRVLHIGTGPGYTAALLGHRFGDAAVTTMEVDPVIAEHARAHLADAGHQPRVVVGDGIHGDPGHGLYDAIISTCALPTIPTAWLEQVRDGGVIITGLHTGLPAGLVIRLTVGDGRASGRFLPAAAALTPARPARPSGPAVVATGGKTRTIRKTRLDSHILDDPDAGLWHALHVGSVARASAAADTRTWLLAGDGSWAAVNDTTGYVSQHGPRRIWDEIETAHHHWTTTGRPRRDRIGVTITATGTQRFWLDTPNTPLWTDTTPRTAT